MVFNSVTFLLFFAIVLTLASPLFGWRWRKTSLLVASYLFYGGWHPWYVSLLLVSTLVDWSVARRIEACEGTGRRRAWLSISLATNLGLLAYFKYAGFFAGILNETLLTRFGLTLTAPHHLLPVGISFYTFQTLSYSIDVYRRRIHADATLADFALFVAFFPQLVAGPIVRAADFLPQLRQPTRITLRQLHWGATLMVVGLFQKIALADAFLAPVADRVYRPSAHPDLVSAWVGTLAFALQIFFDFAGYSTAAIGAALCLGFSLPDNFRSPYAAVGFSDFWRRWHISLSSWLRDYLYIPLGGNQRGGARTFANLMATMLLGGLWHGASWTFVAWGGLHGVYLGVERALRGRLPSGRPWRLLGALITFALVCESWVFFRSHSFAFAGRVLLAMHGGSGGQRIVGDLDAGIVSLLAVGTLGLHHFMRERDFASLYESRPPWQRALFVAGLILLTLVAGGRPRAFIYFQF